MSVKGIRVLHVVSRWFAKGGIENLLKNLVAVSPTRNVEHRVASVLTPIVDSVDCKTYGPLVGSGKLMDVFSQKDAIIKCMSDGFDVVHIHTNNGIGFYYAYLAKMADVKKIIVHCHNAGVDAEKRIFKLAASRLLSFKYKKYATDRWACAKNAGQFLFGSEDFSVFINGVDTSRFQFSSRSRNEIRRALGLTDATFLIGNIGRISEQKNPLFQLEVISELLLIRKDIHFCSVGKGELEEERNQLAQTLGITDHVTYIESTDRPEDYYSAFDALLFPCQFEALSFVGIEAQCSGLKVLASTAVPSELGITKLMNYIPLSFGARGWALCLSDLLDCKVDNRQEYAQIVSEAGFSVFKCFSTIENAYLEVLHD